MASLRQVGGAGRVDVLEVKGGLGGVGVLGGVLRWTLGVWWCWESRLTWASMGTR